MSELPAEMTDEQLAALDFEAAWSLLEQAVGELEGGQIPLDRAIALYQLGQRLREVCRSRLAAAEGLLQTLREQPDGSVALEDSQGWT